LIDENSTKKLFSILILTGVSDCLGRSNEEIPAKLEAVPVKLQLLREYNSVDVNTSLVLILRWLWSYKRSFMVTLHLQWLKYFFNQVLFLPSVLRC